MLTFDTMYGQMHSVGKAINHHHHRSSYLYICITNFNDSDIIMFYSVNDFTMAKGKTLVIYLII